jgi:hypothetical protein
MTQIKSGTHFVEVDNATYPLNTLVGRFDGDFLEIVIWGSNQIISQRKKYTEYSVDGVIPANAAALKTSFTSIVYI